MKKFIVKILIFVCAIYTVIIATNYVVDPANLFHESIIDEMVEKLSEGNIIENPGDVDEGKLLEGMVLALGEMPDTVILGSSRIMYLPWESLYDNPFIGGLPGSYLGDYYEVVGVFEYCHKMPQRIVIGVDPWAFYTDALSGRHTSIADYAVYEKNLIAGENTDAVPNMRDASDFRKMKELVSFAYFQSSGMKMYYNIRTEGVKGLVESARQTVRIVDNDRIGEKSKVLPNCRRVMAKENFYTVKENDVNVEQMLSVGSVYQLGKGFSELDYEHLNEFGELVAYLQEKGIEVVFYLPSWYPTIYDYFCENQEFSGVIKLEAYLREFALEHNITVHGAYNPYVCNVEKQDYADWLHLKAEKMLENFQYVK